MRYFQWLADKGVLLNSMDYYHEFYKKMKHEKPQQYRVYKDKDYKLAINTMSRIIGDNIIDTNAGVFLDDLGYFFNGVVPTKKIHRKGNHIYYNINTNNHTYFTTFVSNQRNHHLRFFTLDKGLAKNLKRRLQDNLKTGFKYRNYLYTLIGSR